MLGMWVWWLAAVALIGAIAVTASRTSKQRELPTEPSAEELRKRRYANGEIEQQDYEERLRKLRK